MKPKWLFVIAGVWLCVLETLIFASHRSEGLMELRYGHLTFIAILLAALLLAYGWTIPLAIGVYRWFRKPAVFRWIRAVPSKWVFAVVGVWFGSIAAAIWALNHLGISFDYSDFGYFQILLCPAFYFWICGWLIPLAFGFYGLLRKPRSSPPMTDFPHPAAR